MILLMFIYLFAGMVFSTRRAGRSSRVFLGMHDQISLDGEGFCKTQKT